MDTASSALLPTLSDAELHAIFRDDQRAIWRYRLLSALLHEGLSVREVAEREHTTAETLRMLRSQFLETGHLDVLRSKRRGAAGHLKRQTPLAQAVARELAADPGATAATVWRRVSAGLGPTNIAVPRRTVYRLVDSLRDQLCAPAEPFAPDELWAPALVPLLRAALGLLAYDTPLELGQSELAAQVLPQEPDVEQRGRWLRDVLIEALLAIGPPSLERLPNVEPTLHDPVYRAFDILVGEAWHGRSREEMETALAVAPATYSRAKRQGLEQLADIIAQKAMRKRLSGPHSAPPPVMPILGREREVQYYGQRLREDGFALIWGMPGSGKSALALTLAHQRHEAGDMVIWHPCLGAGIGILHALLDSFGVQHDTSSMDTPELLALLRGQLRYGTTLVLEQFDLIICDSVTEILIAMLRTMVATRSLHLLIVSRCLPRWAEGKGWSPLNGLMDDGARNVWTLMGGAVLDPTAWHLLYQRTLGYPRLLQMLANDVQSSLAPFFHDDVIAPLTEAEHQALLLLVFARAPLRTTDDIADVSRIVDPDIESAFRGLRCRDLVTYDAGSDVYHLHVLLQTHRGLLRDLLEEPATLQQTLAKDACAAGRWYDAIVHWSAEGQIDRIAETVAVHLDTLIAERHGPSLIELLRALRGQAASGVQLAQIEATIGTCYLALGAYHHATEAFRTAIELSGSLPNGVARLDLRQWHFLLAEAYQQMGQWRHALTHVYASVGNERLVIGDVPPEQRMALALLQHRIWVQAGEVEQARYWLADVQTQLQSYYHPFPAAIVAYMEGVQAMYYGRFDRAAARFEDARTLLPCGVLHGIQCEIVANLALSRAALGEFEDACRIIQAQLPVTLGIGHQSGAIALTLALVEVLLDAGNADEAALTLGQAELYAEDANIRTTARLLLARAALAVQRPTGEPALDHLMHALETVSEPPLPALMARAYLLLARLSVQQGAIPTSAQHAARAVRIATSAGLLRYRAQAYLFLVRDAIVRHAWAEAAELLKEAALETDDPLLDGERALLQTELLTATGEPDAAQAALQRAVVALQRAPVYMREMAERQFPGWATPVERIVEQPSAAGPRSASKTA